MEDNAVLSLDASEEAYSEELVLIREEMYSRFLLHNSICVGTMVGWHARATRQPFLHILYLGGKTLPLARPSGRAGYARRSTKSVRNCHLSLGIFQRTLPLSPKLMAVDGT